MSLIYSDYLSSAVASDPLGGAEVDTVGQHFYLLALGTDWRDGRDEPFLTAEPRQEMTCPPLRDRAAACLRMRAAGRARDCR